ncbi:MAG TPA: hydantoinase/oxoprolinase family protein [Burkholderiaceae bacterium]|nr:hydantoinase/oxoprolinase family protein [Burkholderiaceae bacterium]
MTSAAAYRVGADIGGTFTDIVVADDQGGLHTRKVSSTPDDYGRAIVDGLTGLLRDIGAAASQVIEVIHATTVATNTVLEGKGARTALITTRGFRDVLEIGRLRAPVMYDLGYAKQRALALRRHRYEVSERLRADGSIDTPLDEGGLDAIVSSLRQEGIEAVAVSLLHAYANPVHELRIRELLAQAFGDRIYITCSHEILPEIREYERTSTTVVNAYLGPVVVGYLHSLMDKLHGMGIYAPLRIMHSNGGVMTADAVMRKPACIIESGPAAGVIAGAHAAVRSGRADAITVDMGGTTAKAAIVEQGQPARTTEYEVGAGINLSSKLVKGGGHAVKLPFIDVSEIGAGGGSKVRLDAGGLIQVGPDSAGSVPGPVCYGTGGTTPTLTDAFVTLGYLNPRQLAGGEVLIQAPLALQAMRDAIATPTGLSLHDAAYGVLSVAAATMTRAVKAVSVYRGRDPREFALIAFGGNGPVIAHAIARLVDMKTVLVPPSPGVFSAVGLLHSQTQHEFMRTLFRRLDQLRPGELQAGLIALQAQAHDEMAGEGYALDAIRLQPALDLRYAGQAFELTVPVAGEVGAADFMRRVVQDFHAEHRKTYGHASITDAIEVVNLRVSGTLAQSSAFSAGWLAHGAGRAAPSSRTAYFGPGFGLLETPVLGRDALRQGPVQGPLIVEEYDSTVVIPPGASAMTDEHHNIVITL